MKRAYTLQLNTLQAVVLLYFNSRGDSYVPFKELQDALNIEEVYLKRVMHSLTCGKYKLLLKENDSKKDAKKIKPNDAFRVNAKFVSKKMRIAVPMASLEVSHKPQKVEEDRKHAVEACIVRVMKARKRLPHNQLMTSVLEQLHFFRPKPKMVKRRIEDLIQREYLERDEADSSVYKYLA